MSLPRYEPMLATRWPAAFSDPRWSFEVKWDGVRVLAFWDGNDLRLRSRRGRDVTASYPEIATMSFPRPAVLDGEVIAFDEGGRPSFERLQSRINLTGRRRVTDAARAAPVTVVLFDVLFEGEEMVGEPFEARVARLDALSLPEGILRSDRVEGEGEALFEAAREKGLEGIVAKRLGSPYRPGVRSGDWRKVAALQRARAVVGGFLPGEGGRARTLGSLLLGLFRDGELVWIGSVGTGFDDESLAHIRAALDQLRTQICPFVPDPDLPSAAVWVLPSLVAHVEFKQWTRAGRLRAPSFKGFAAEPPEEVTWESEGPLG